MNIQWPYCTVHVYVVIKMCDSMWSFWVDVNLCLCFLHRIVCKCIIQLSKGEGRDHINWFNLAIFMCLSQARTWISNVICYGLSCVLCVQLRWEVIVHFVDICGIDDHHCLNFLFTVRKSKIKQKEHATFLCQCL